MAKPTVDYDWATGAGANIIEPDTATKTNGWQFKQIPPSGWQNHQMNAVSQWLDWLVAEVDNQRLPTSSGRVLLKRNATAGGTAENPQQYLSWKKYDDGEVDLQLEGYLPFPVDAGGEQFGYNVFDESGVGDAIQAPWGYDCTRSIHTSATFEGSSSDVPVPVIFSFDSETGPGFSFTRFSVLQLADITIDTVDYKIYKEPLTASTAVSAYHIHPFTAVL